MYTAGAVNNIINHMGLFYTAPRKPSMPTSGTTSFSHSGHLSSREVVKEVRRDLHDRLGEHKGEQVFEILNAHLDRDNGRTGVSGQEVEGMLSMLERDHHDNLHSNDIAHIKEVLGKHFND